jgi:predicted DNA-binding transcriptional regulator YafY
MLRYQVLDRCFRNTGRKYFWEDLKAECDKVLAEIAPDSTGVSRRQIFSDITFMESGEGWSVDLVREKEDKRVYYRYADTSFSINNMPLNELEIKHLQSAMEILSHFKGMPQFEWVHELLPKLKQGIPSAESDKIIIEFDHNQYLKGIEYIGVLYNAIMYEKVLKIRYCTFVNESPFDMEIHPYFLKQYNNRWFLFGYNPAHDKYGWCLALDRIKDIAETNRLYVPNTQIDWTDYFEDIVGVTKPDNAPVEHIVLHFYGITGKYIETKPLHGSQKSQWINDQTLEVSMNLMVNHELTSLVLSYADSVKVMQPEGFASIIRDKLERGLGQYKINK